ncbi:unnamed protein product, partial [Fusarium langsethiae]
MEKQFQVNVKRYPISSSPLLIGHPSDPGTPSEHDDQQEQQRQLPSLLPPEEPISHVPNHMLRQQGAVSSNRDVKQPPSSQGLIPIDTTNGVQRESGRTKAIAIEEGLLLRLQQLQQQQRQSLTPPQQQPSSPSPFAGNARTAMSSMPPAQGTAL